MADIASPNMSMGLNASLGANDSFKVSPYNALRVNQDGIHSRRSFSPMIANIKTPEISPITKQEKAEESPSYTFLHRRDSPCAAIAAKKMEDRIRAKRHKRYTMYTTPDYTPVPANSPMSQLDNSNLNKNLCVSTILKDLDLEYMDPIFVSEEIDLKVFMTLSEEDLKLIGITKDDDIKKILKFIASSTSTPSKNTSSLSTSS